VHNRNHVGAVHTLTNKCWCPEDERWSRAEHPCPTSSSCISWPLAEITLDAEPHDPPPPRHSVPATYFISPLRSPGSTQQRWPTFN